MQRLKYFSGIKPTLEDLEFDQTGKESAILDRQKEMFSDGVAVGLELVLNDGLFTLEPGVAYIGGERVQVADEIVVQIDGTSLPCYLVLKYSQIATQTATHFITGEEHQIHLADSFETVLRTSPALRSGELLVAEITAEGIIDRRTFVRLAVDERMHAPNTDVGTTAAEFRIGQGDPRHPDGLRVLTESPTPKLPLNLRITAIRPDNLKGAAHNAQGLQLSSNLGRSSGYAQVLFAWDYRDIVGESIAADTFRLDNSGYAFTTDQLKGYYLTFDSGEEFNITGNAATSGGRTLLTVIGDLQGLSADQHPAVIHPGATEYRFTAIPVEVDVNTPIVTNPSLPAPSIGSLPVALEERIEGFTVQRMSPTASSCMLRLPLGRHFIFQVQAVRRLEASIPKVMGAGTFTWQGRQIDYGCPFLVVLPLFGAASVNLTPLPNATGFSAEVNGWDEAELLEYGWTRLSEDEDVTIDFSASGHHPGVTSHHDIRIITAEDVLEQVAAPTYANRLLNLDSGIDAVTRLTTIRRRYKFAVRSLIGGQVVGEAVSRYITLRSDPYAGQAAVVNAVQALTRNLDLLNKSVRNLDAIRSAQAARVEDQLMTLNSAVQAGQQYAQFSVSDINLPFPEVQNDIPLLGRDSPEGSLLFDLDPELTEQTFSHNLGHLNYIVQVRDGNSVVVGADIDLNENDVVIRLSEAMAGTVIIIDGQHSH